MSERPVLRVLDGRGSDHSRRDEVRIELIAQLREVDDFVGTALPVVEEWRDNLVKLGRRNRAAWDEVMALGGGNDAA